MNSVENIREQLEEVELKLARLTKKVEGRNSALVPTFNSGESVNYSLDARGGKYVLEVALASNALGQLYIKLDEIEYNFDGCVGRIECYFNKGIHSLIVRYAGANNVGGLLSIYGNNIIINGGA